METQSQFAHMTSVARKWVEKHPELADRLQRALALVGGVEQGAEPGVFVVEGGAGGPYFVRGDHKNHTSGCTCPDFMFRQAKCKHILACALVVVCKGGE